MFYCLSNSSFQLPGFCMPRMLKEEDEESDSDGGDFEAVTPEHNSETAEERGTNPAVSATEKHRHILEDVDGELEMEDVAPCSEEMNSTSNVSGVYTDQCEQQFSLPIGPPLPSDMPPLPTSPPPPAPPPPSSLPPPTGPPPSAVSHAFTNGVDSQRYMDAHVCSNSSLFMLFLFSFFGGVWVNVFITWPKKSVQRG